MEAITCKELNYNSGAAIEKARRSTILVEKYGKPWVVMLSYEQYETLKNSHEFLSMLVSKDTGKLFDEARDIIIKTIANLKSLVRQKKLEKKKVA